MTGWKRTYSVAGCALEVLVPEGWDLGTLLPNFRGFVVEESSSDLVLDARESRPLGLEGERLLDSSDNEAGKTRLYAAGETYVLRLSHGPSGLEHSVRFQASKPMRARAHLQWDDPLAGRVLSSMLRILFAQVLLLQGGLSVHASAVVSDRRAYLFTGPSGTGKSTHAGGWCGVFRDTELLNDDNPALRPAGGSFLACGTPWSGKTPCHRSVEAPLAGLVRLRQAPRNRFEPLEDVQAFATLLPSCTAIRTDPVLHAALCDNLAALVASVPVGALDCLPDEAAARLCKESLRKVPVGPARPGSAAPASTRPGGGNSTRPGPKKPAPATSSQKTPCRRQPTDKQETTT